MYFAQLSFGNAELSDEETNFLQSPKQILNTINCAHELKMKDPRISACVFAMIPYLHQREFSNF